jgi:predicted RNA-binding Zn-ribbon protein involved in translation (DUF1610 family)
MTRELVDRMRTCAAAIEAGTGFHDMVAADAGRLLRIAADLLDTPEPLGEPMEVLRQRGADQTNVPPQPTTSVGQPVWGGSLNAVARPCPSCGSVDARRAKRVGRQVQLTCPVCEHQWDYGT